MIHDLVDIQREHSMYYSLVVFSINLKRIIVTKYKKVNYYVYFNIVIKSKSNF